MFSEFLTRASSKNRQGTGIVRTTNKTSDAVWPIHQGCLFTRWLPVDCRLELSSKLTEVPVIPQPAAFSPQITYTLRCIDNVVTRLRAVRSENRGSIPAIVMQLLVQRAVGNLSPSIKWSTHKIDRKPSFSGNVKNAWSHITTQLYVLMAQGHLYMCAFQYYHSRRYWNFVSLLQISSLC